MLGKPRPATLLDATLFHSLPAISDVILSSALLIWGRPHGLARARGFHFEFFLLLSIFLQFVDFLVSLVWFSTMIFFVKQKLLNITSFYLVSCVPVILGYYFRFRILPSRFFWIHLDWKGSCIVLLVKSLTLKLPNTSCILNQGRLGFKVQWSSGFGFQ